MKLFRYAFSEIINQALSASEGFAIPINIDNAITGRHDLTLKFYRDEYHCVMSENWY